MFLFCFVELYDSQTAYKPVRDSLVVEKVSSAFDKKLGEKKIPSLNFVPNNHILITSGLRGDMLPMPIQGKKLDNNYNWLWHVFNSY